MRVEVVVPKDYMGMSGRFREPRVGSEKEDRGGGQTSTHRVPLSEMFATRRPSLETQGRGTYS